MSVSTETSITGTYAIDPSHSSIGFVARHAMITKVRGFFEDFEGSFTIDEANIAASTASFTAQVASINTKNADRDAHLKSADFFDADQFPTVTFTATSAAKKGDDYVVTGDLAMHGVSKSVEVVFEFTGTSLDPFGNTRVGFEGSAEVNRKDFGLTWNAALETGGVLVSENIKIVLEISAIKQ